MKAQRGRLSSSRGGSSSSVLARSVFARGLSVALVIACAAGPAGSAFAAPDAATEASEHFQRGVDFSKDGDFEAALVEFKRAYELSPNFRVLYNLDQTSRELRDYAGALRSFQEYLKEGGPDAPKRDKVEGWVTELKSKVATLTIKVNLPGAEVAVDDVSVGAAPLKDPVFVNAGKRKVSATLSGYVPIQKYVDIAGTDAKTLALELAPINTSNGNGSGGDTGRVVPARKGSVVPWIALGGTLGFGVATATLGGLTLSAKSTFDKDLDTFPGNPSKIESDGSKARRFAVAADVLGGITAAGAIATVVLFVTMPVTSTPEHVEKRAFYVPEVGVGVGSFELRGRF